LAVDVQVVLETFDPALFLPSLAAPDKDSVLQELVAHVQAQGLVREREPLLEMLRSRESLGSTGIGHGIAVPHGRSLAVPRLVGGFARHAAGVPWDAVDGKPVHLIFLILAPPLEQPTRYLPFLGRIVEAVSDADRRKRLAKAATYEEFRRALRDALA
jgi:mannitol/fructose-specific phosphotransferase system IIA component (Ntr-type)